MSVGTNHSTIKASVYSGGTAISKLLKSEARRGLAKLDNFAQKHELPKFAHSALNKLPSGFPGKNHLRQALNRIVGGPQTQNSSIGVNSGNSDNARPHYSQNSFQHVSSGASNHNFKFSPPERSQTPGEISSPIEAYADPSILQRPQPIHQNVEALTSRNKLMDAVARFENQVNGDFDNDTFEDSSVKPSPLVADRFTESPGPIHSSTTPSFADRFTESPEPITPTFTNRFTEAPEPITPDFTDRFTESPAPLTGDSIDSYNMSQSDNSYANTAKNGTMSSQSASLSSTEKDNGDYFNQKHDSINPGKTQPRAQIDDFFDISESLNSSTDTTKDSGDYFNQKHDAIDPGKAKPRTQIDDYFGISETLKEQK